MTRATLLAVALLVALAWPAAAWDPEDRSWEPPAWDDVSWWDPEPADWWEPEPACVAPSLGYGIPDGIYLVTEVYSADVISTAGPVTTYSTETYRDTPGTYARVLETVATGADSALDGAAFNGRASLSDGRPVAGTYYENFILTQGGFQPVSIVFFQDDREVAPAPSPVPVAVPTPPPPVAVIPPPVVSVVPIVETRPPATAAPREERDAPTPAPQRVTVGLAPAPLGDARPTLEVLRGRATTLWARATFDGAPARVASWRLTSGDLVALGAVAGSGDLPLRARWDRVGEAPTRLALSIETRRGPVDVTAEILVIVRAPALIP